MSGSLPSPDGMPVGYWLLTLVVALAFYALGRLHARATNRHRRTLAQRREPGSAIVCVGGAWMATDRERLGVPRPVVEERRAQSALRPRSGNVANIAPVGRVIELDEFRRFPDGGAA